MHVLILADIEGSSGCFSREAAASMTPAWRRACWEMTADVRTVVLALQQAGISRITIHDFHRTGYNLIPQLMPKGCRLVSGYRAGPVPGIGDPDGADALMMIGMHAPSGSRGFLAHTLTSRLAALHVNGRLLSEAQLFSASLAPYGVRPIFFSGCPLACEQAFDSINGLSTYSIDKSKGKAIFDQEKWRDGLAAAAVDALRKKENRPYILKGPFNVRLAMRDGPEVAAKLSRRWHLDSKHNILYFECPDFDTLYDRLLSICYLTPLLARYRSKSLKIYSLWGKMGRWWVQTMCRPNGII